MERVDVDKPAYPYVANGGSALMLVCETSLVPGMADIDAFLELKGRIENQERIKVELLVLVAWGCYSRFRTIPKRRGLQWPSQDQIFFRSQTCYLLDG